MKNRWKQMLPAVFLSSEGFSQKCPLGRSLLPAVGQAEGGEAGLLPGVGGQGREAAVTGAPSPPLSPLTPQGTSTIMGKKRYSPDAGMGSGQGMAQEGQGGQNDNI